MANPNEIQADPTKGLTGAALIAARKAAEQPIQSVQATQPVQPVQPVSTQPIQPTPTIQPVATGQLQADPTSGLTGSALIEARKAMQATQTPAQSPTPTPVQAPVQQTPAQTPNQKPATPDFNTGVGREQDIIANLAEGLKSDATVQKAIQSGDIATFKQKYGYDQADETKKRLLDQFFTTNQPRDEGSFYNLLRSGQQITSPTLTRLPAFKIAQERANDFNKFSQYNVNQISSALLSGSLIEGTKVYQDLQNDPAMKAKLDQAKTFNTASSKTTDQKGIELNVSNDILKNNQTTAQMLEDNFISPDEYRQALNTAEIDIQRKDVEASRIKYDTLKATYDSVEDDVEKEYGTISSSAKAALIADRRKGIYRDLSVAESTYNAKLGTLTDMKKEAAAIFDQNISLYKDSLNAKRDEERLALQFEYANPSITSSNPRIAQVAAQKIIGEALAFAQTNGIPVQRNSGQILSDAQSYATANGVSLADALQETFTKPFVAKNEYKAALSNIQDARAPAGKLQVIGERIDPTTGTKISVYGTVDKSGNVIEYNTGAQASTSIADFTTTRNGSTSVQCGELVNDYWKSITGSSAGIGDTLSSKEATVKKIGQSNSPIVGGIFVSNPLGNSVGHTGIVQEVNSDGSIVVREANAKGSANGQPPISKTYSAQQVKNMIFSVPPTKPVSEKAGKGGVYTDDQLALMQGITGLTKETRAALAGAGLTDSDWGKFNDGQLPPTKTQERTARGVIDTMDSLLRLDGFKDAVGFSGPINMLTFGKVIPGTDRANFVKKFESFRDNLVLPNLGQLKGPMSDKDIQFLKSTATSLDLDMSEEVFKETLQELRAKYEEILKKGNSNQYSGASIVPKPGTATQNFLLNNR